MKSITELMSLSGRVAVVTGGGGYIGSTFCEALAEVGASLVVVDISKEKSEATSTSITSKFDVETMALIIDMADEQQVRSVPEIVMDRFGRLDILINCAAFVGTSDLKGWVAPFLEQEVETWRQAFEVNLTSTFVLIQKCVPYLEQSGKGVIINIGSIYGVVGPDMDMYEGTQIGVPAAYAASKGGLVQFTRWLASVLAPKIRVNALSPGGVWRNQDINFRRRYSIRTPLDRMALEEDLKGAAVFLSSDMSAYMTGQNLIIDGGWTVSRL